MATQHKLANARIEVDSALPVDRVLEIARHAVGTQRSLGIIGEEATGIKVSLNGLIGGALMQFVVTAELVDGRTRVVSSIQKYRTSQTTVYFIPVGPKSMEGIGVYRRFMTTFGQAIQAADPTARIRMIEREDREPVTAGGMEATAVPPVPPAPDAPSAARPASPLPPTPAPPPASMPAAPPPPPPPVAAPLPSTAPAASAPARPAVAPVAQSLSAEIPQPATRGVTAPTGVSESSGRAVQIGGGVILVAGIIFWYATPRDVTVGPILVCLLGAAVSGVGFLMVRRANSAASDELSAKLRQERALNEAAAAASAPIAQTAPTAVPSVPLPPVPAPSPSASAAPGQSAGLTQDTPPLIASIPVLTPAASMPPLPVSTEHAIASAPPASFDGDLDATRVTPSAATAWQLVLGDGRIVPVRSAVRFGRDPVAEATDPTVILIPLADPAKSVSKTHAQLDVRAGVLLVTDLHSTNGTVLVTDSATQLSPGRPQEVTGDSELRLGDYVLQIRRTILSTQDV